VRYMSSGLSHECKKQINAERKHRKSNVKLYKKSGKIWREMNFISYKNKKSKPSFEEGIGNESFQYFRGQFAPQNGSSVLLNYTFVIQT